MSKLLEKLKHVLRKRKEDSREKFSAKCSLSRYYKRTGAKTMALGETTSAISFHSRKSRNDNDGVLRKWYSAQARIYDLKITIGETDRFKIFEFVKASPVEVYLPMLVKRRGNHFHLYKPLFLKQKGTKMNTDLDREDEDRYIRELIYSDQPFEKTQEELLNMRCWIHSHFGECWWSDKDDKNCERANNKDFFISVVVRVARDCLYYNCRLDLFPLSDEAAETLKSLNIYRPERLTLTDLFIEVIDDRGQDFNPEKIKQEAQSLVDEKVEILRRKNGKKNKNDNNENGDKYDDCNPENFKESIGYPISDDDDGYRD